MRTATIGSVHRRARRLRRRLAAIGTMAVVLSIAGVAYATHGSSIIDVSTAGASVEHDDALFVQGGVGAGTGNFDPFLQIQETGNGDGVQEGYNTDDNAVLSENDTKGVNSGQTHSVYLAALPTVEIGGVLYREILLDSNDPGADPYMSVDELKVFLDDQPDLTGYNQAAETFATDTGPTAFKVYDLDASGDQTVLMNTQGLESGSGVSDLGIYIADSYFPADCSFGNLDCGLFFILYSKMGGFGMFDGKDWDTTSGFEEFKFRPRPVVDIDKTATTSLTRTYGWDISKEVSVDGGATWLDADSPAAAAAVDLFEGDSADIQWRVTAGSTGFTDSEWNVSGTVTVTNPTGSEILDTPLDADITSITDTLNLGADQPVSLNCDTALPSTLAPGDSITCTYSVDLASDPGSIVGTNTAAVVITTADGDATYTASAEVDFDPADGDAEPAVTEVDKTATVSDPGGFADVLVTAGDNFQQVIDDSVDCTQDLWSNTASVTPTDSGVAINDSAYVAVTCYGLEVTKTADTSFDRTFDWTLVKQVSVDGGTTYVDAASVDLFNGSSQSALWRIAITKSAPIDSGYAVEGEITITNDAPIDAVDVSVSDTIDGVGSPPVDCDGDPTNGAQNTVTVPANDSVICTYGSDMLPNGDDRLNTATASLFGEDYVGTADVSFAGVTPSITDDSATLVDTRLNINRSYLDSIIVLAFDSLPCDDNSRTEVNSATLTEADSGTAHDDSAQVTLSCYGLTVTKTAETSFTRAWDWEIAKTRVFLPGEVDGDGDPTTLDLMLGQQYDVGYEVTVNTTGFVDSGWAVDGVITVSNASPLDAVGVVVSDSLAGVGAVAVDCDGLGGDTVDIPAGGTAQCSYSTAVGDAGERLNTATATLNSVDYTGDATATFGAPTSLVDECVNVSDDNGTSGDPTDDLILGQVCADTGSKTFSYTTMVGPFDVCGEYTFTNTATFTVVDDDNDTGESGSAEYTITITIPCLGGCTLTQGYWRTHNDTFWGGAPTDDTWLLLGDVDGDGVVEGEGEDFYNSGLTYFEVMWEAPAGNSYFVLGRQYIAAVLNGLNEADTSAITAELAAADTLFSTYTPEQVAAAKGKNGRELRAQFIGLSNTLTDYNEGRIGPGHCDEDHLSR